jgi:hypothetical protein
VFLDLPPGIFGTLTPSVLLGVCVLFILTGRLVPVKTHERELGIRDKEIDYLRDALDTCREAEQRRTDQVAELIEHSRVTYAIINALSIGTEEKMTA